MRLVRSAFAFALFSLAAPLAACGGASEREGEEVASLASSAATASGPNTTVVRFDADWTVTTFGQLRQGDVVAIEYDDARLPSCRGRKYGMPAWSILAHYRYPSGKTGTIPVSVGGDAPATRPVIELTEAGPMALWFEGQDIWGCREWDSRFGQNYRLAVAENEALPGWVGNAAFVISRQTCAAGPCDRDRVPLDNGFTYETFARQRAAIRAIYFDVWKQGVTDFDNPDLWKQLDVQVHFRARKSGPFQSRYVSVFGRVGNDARYQLPMAVIDPLAGSFRRTDPAECPDADLAVAGEPDGPYVTTTVEYYFTINGLPLRRADGSNFVGRFDDYRYQFEVCLPGN